ncbi:MAG: aspartate kinase [Bdellovibrionaceae bacterium]|nr:aspartate kinase [Pseudobdellovibrionaceae bacterium]MDW8190097.1 aspartate kinase [Pseudobdellovibrionaceae bacterium]
MIVQKFGGATVETPEKIRQISTRITEALTRYQKIIAVVSAMGKTTQQLLQLALTMSPRPNLRELDMLLTTGERISASLLTMALIEKGVKAVSLTGSQAGIITDENHFNAHIVDIRPERLARLLQHHDVIVLAGFQGVSMEQKNITTLGRGGSDTTAIAIAAALGAKACHIIKEVPAIFTADPKQVKSARFLKNLSFDECARLTFWGAKVLHYRSVKLAQRYSIPIFVGPVNLDSEHGTWIQDQFEQTEIPMYEKPHFFAITAHRAALKITIICDSCLDAQTQIGTTLKEHQIIDPLILHVYQSDRKKVNVLLTSPEEVIDQIKNLLPHQSRFTSVTPTSIVSIHARPVTSPALQELVIQKIRPWAEQIDHMFVSDQGMHFCVPPEHHEVIIKTLHQLLETAESSKE